MLVPTRLLQYFSNEQCFLAKSRLTLKQITFLVVSSITCFFLPQQFITMRESSCLQFQMTLWMCNWIFPPPFVGHEFLQFLVEEMVSFPFFPCQTHGVPVLLHVLNLLTTFTFAWATPSCSNTLSCIFFPFILKCFYHLLCLQLLFRASLLCSVFHSTDKIISKLTNFLFNNSGQCYCLFRLIRVITYCCLAYVSVVTLISLVHWPLLCPSLWAE